MEIGRVSKKGMPSSLKKWLEKIGRDPRYYGLLPPDGDRPPMITNGAIMIFSNEAFDLPPMNMDENIVSIVQQYWRNTNDLLTRAEKNLSGHWAVINPARAASVARQMAGALHGNDTIICTVSLMPETGEVGIDCIAGEGRGTVIIDAMNMGAFSSPDEGIIRVDLAYIAPIFKNHGDLLILGIIPGANPLLIMRNRFLVAVLNRVHDT